MSLRDVEASLRALTLSATGDDGAFADAPKQRRDLYRSLVNNTLRGAIARACPFARRIGGEARFDAALTRFLDEHRIRTRLTHELPGEFTAWLMQHEAGSAYAELCHFEALDVEVTMAETSPAGGMHLADGARIDVDTSCRLVAYRHPVHTVTVHSTALPAPTSEPTVLMCFQRAEAFCVEPVSAAVGKVIMQAAQGATVREAVATVVAEGSALGVNVDTGLIRATLVRLRHLGAIAGFQPR